MNGEVCSFSICRNFQWERQTMNSAFVFSVWLLFFRTLQTFNERPRVDLSDVKFYHTIHSSVKNKRKKKNEETSGDFIFAFDALICVYWIANSCAGVECETANIHLNAYEQLWFYELFFLSFCCSLSHSLVCPFVRFVFDATILLSQHRFYRVKLFCY